MAEVVGAVSGILGIATVAVKTTSTLINLISSIKGAPQTVSNLHDNLHTLQIVLDRLVEVERSFPTDKKEGNLTNPTKNAVRACNRVLEKISDGILEPLQDRLKGGKIQASWAMIRTATMETIIKDNLMRLEHSKTNLVLALAVDELYARRIGDHHFESRRFSLPQNSAQRDSSEIGSKVNGRESDLKRGESRGETISKLRQSVPTETDNDSPPDCPPSYSAPTSEPSFSQILTATLENVENAISCGQNADQEQKIGVFEMLRCADLDKMQSVWKPNPQTVENLKYIIQDYSRDIFVQSLKALPLTKHEVKDAAPSTFEWIWGNKIYIDWRQSRESQMLLLRGKVGSGKSVFAKTVLGKISAEAGKPNSRNVAVLSYFCNNRKRPEESCTNALRAFICQFLRSNKTEFGRMAENCEALKYWDPSAENFEFSFDVLWDIFSCVLDSPDKTEFYCIIDAMDECEQDATEEEFISRLPILFKARRNASLKFFISSRPDWMTETDFSLISLKPLNICLHPELMRGDIAQVIELEFCKIQNILTIEEDEKAELKEKLVSKANGMILWAILALREISKRLGITPKWLREMVEKLPSGLSEIYHEMLKNLVKKHGGNDESSQEVQNDFESDLCLAWRLLQWVARAGRPLTLKELQVAIALDTHDVRFEDVREKMISNIESAVRRIPFLEIAGPDDRVEEFDLVRTSSWEREGLPFGTMTPSSTVRLIHQSAKDYLLKNAIPLDGDVEYEGVKLSKFDDSNVVELCLTFLQFRDFAGGPVREFAARVRFIDAFRAHIERFILLEYAASFWAYHLKRVSEPDEHLVSLISSFACDSHNHVRFWCQVASFLRGYTDFVEDHFGLHVVAAEGVESMVKYFIKRGYDLNKRDQLGRTPYIIAQLRGHSEIAKLLEENGADTSVELPGVLGLQPADLQLAAERGDQDEVTRLLDQGVEVDEEDSYGRTALFYACSSGDVGTISLLLGAGASLGVKDKRGRIPLDVALAPECRELVIKEMGKLGIECTTEQLSKSPCTHHTEGEFFCDRCGRAVWTFYYHCCDCSGDDSFDVCQECWDKGNRCLADGHRGLRRVNADSLYSWLEYTPHLAGIEFECPLEEVKKIQKHEVNEKPKDKQKRRKNKYEKQVRGKVKSIGKTLSCGMQ